MYETSLEHIRIGNTVQLQYTYVRLVDTFLGETT